MVPYIFGSCSSYRVKDGMEFLSGKKEEKIDTETITLGQLMSKYFRVTRKIMNRNSGSTGAAKSFSHHCSSCCWSLNFRMCFLPWIRACCLLCNAGSLHRFFLEYFRLSWPSFHVFPGHEVMNRSITLNWALLFCWVCGSKNVNFAFLSSAPIIHWCHSLNPGDQCNASLIRSVVINKYMNTNSSGR